MSELSDTFASACMIRVRNKLKTYLHNDNLNNHPKNLTYDQYLNI